MIEFELGRVFRRSWEEFNRGIAAYLLIAVLGIGASLIIIVVGLTALLPFGLASLLSGAAPGASWLSAAALTVVVVLTFALMAVSLGLTLMQLEVTSQLFSGYRPDVQIAYQWSLRKFWRMAGLVIILGISLTIGYLFLILPGIFLTIVWALAPYILVKEDLGPIDALQRSTTLTIRVFGWVLLAVLVIVVAALVIGAIEIFPIIGPVIGFFLVLGLGLFSQTYHGAIYEELRRIEVGQSARPVASTPPVTQPTIGSSSAESGSKPAAKHSSRRVKPDESSA